MLLIYGLLSAGVTAFIFGIITKLVDLIIVFPLFMGLMAGVGTKYGARKGHCRNTMLIVAVAFLMGLACYGGKHYVTYRTNRQNAVREIQAEMTKNPIPAGQPVQSADELYDTFLTMKTGSSGFWGWLKLTLESGISISSHGSGGVNLGYVGTLVLLLVELLLAGVCSAFLAATQSDEPYCEKCLRWVDYKQVFHTTPQYVIEVGKTVLAQPDDAIPKGLLQRPPAGDPGGDHGLLNLVICPSCRDGYLSGEMKDMNQENKQETKGLFKNVAFPQDSWKDLFEGSGDQPPSPPMA